MIVAFHENFVLEKEFKGLYYVTYIHKILPYNVRILSYVNDK